MRRVRWMGFAVLAGLLGACHGDRSTATGGDVPPIDTSGLILFGDLHVHSTLSVDAQFYNTSFFDGANFAPPAEACEFARHCAALDFWAITDHAELLFPEEWQATKETVRACEAAYGEDAGGAMTSFVGFEWTNFTPELETHYGHKNVIFRDLADDAVAARPIAAGNVVTNFFGGGAPGAAALSTLAPEGEGEEPPARDPAEDLAFLLDLFARTIRSITQPECDRDVPVRDLPADCLEVAKTPAEVYAKLRDWGYPATVIPHGQTWAINSPAGWTWLRDLGTPNADPAFEWLLEVYSGHGNSEEWRPYRHFEGEGDDVVCPEATAEFEPCCRRAGVLARTREPACLDDPESPACDEAVREVERAFIADSIRGVRSFNARYPESPTIVADWLDCGQCRTCRFNPTNGMRPGGSAQAALALAKFDEDGPEAAPARHRFGLVGSTDDHRAKPGLGFKESKALSDILGLADGALEAEIERAGSFLNDMIFAQNSFYFSGAVLGAHVRARTRAEIWDALGRKDVYATSGPRILLWFDALAPGRAEPIRMGATVALAASPTFRVRAQGDWVQAPGCPEDVVDAVGAEFVADVCRGECYHPGASRVPIERIEVVRIRPQTRPGEPLGPLIEDPWRTFECPGTPEGCEVSFADPDYARSGRPAVYYARALQAPTPVLNAATLRCEGVDETGACTRVEPCFGGGRGAGDDCLGPARHRAWSSPIFVERPPAPR